MDELEFPIRNWGREAISGKRKSERGWWPRSLKLHMSEIELMVFLLNLTHSWCCPSLHPSNPTTQQTLSSLSLMAPPLGGFCLLAPSGSTLPNQCHLPPEPVTSLQHFHSCLLAGHSATCCFSLPNQYSQCGQRWS